MYFAFYYSAITFLNNVLFKMNKIMQLNQMRVEKPNVAQLNPSQTSPKSVVLISIKIAGLTTKNIWATKVMMPAINNHGPFAVFL